MGAVNNFSFSTISECLICGREIEFSYQGKQYSITNSNGYWNFCCDTDNRFSQRICPFGNKDALIDYMKRQSIDGTPLSTIFDNKQFDDSSICIL